jgi:hypothetical protein
MLPRLFSAMVYGQERWAPLWRRIDLVYGAESLDP